MYFETFVKQDIFIQTKLFTQTTLRVILENFNYYLFLNNSNLNLS